MFLFRKPSDQFLTDFVTSQTNKPFSYHKVGATRGSRIAGYTVDHNRTQLGFGQDVFERAAEALRRWQQFELGWVRITNADVVPARGATVAVLAKAAGLWSLNACRVVYIIEQDGRDPGSDYTEEDGERMWLRRYGYAYGTLREHVERGEERFLIEWNAVDDSVWYDILAFSRPRHFLAKLTKPYVRSLQKRFTAGSLRALMQLADRQNGQNERGS